MTFLGQQSSAKAETCWSSNIRQDETYERVHSHAYAGSEC